MITVVHAPARWVTGQALTECLVACLLLVPVWWFVQHWIDGQRHRAALQSQLRVAAFAESLAPGLGSLSTPMLRGADIAVSRTHTPGLAGAAERAASDLLAPVQALAPGSIDMRADGWIRVELSVDAPAHPFWRRASRRWRESLVLLVDDWSAFGPQSVEQRTQTLLPSSSVEWVLAALDAIGGPIAVLEPALRGTCARRIDPEIVPEDRLVGIRESTSPLQPASGWTPRC